MTTTAPIKQGENRHDDDIGTEGLAHFETDPLQQSDLAREATDDQRGEEERHDHYSKAGSDEQERAPAGSSSRVSTPIRKLVVGREFNSPTQEAIGRGNTTQISR